MEDWQEENQNQATFWPTYNNKKPKKNNSLD